MTSTIWFPSKSRVLTTDPTDPTWLQETELFYNDLLVIPRKDKDEMIRILANTFDLRKTSLRELPYFVKRHIALDECDLHGLRYDPSDRDESIRKIMAFTEEHDDAERWIVMENEASAPYYRFERYERRARKYDENGEIKNPRWLHDLDSFGKDVTLVVSYHPSIDRFTANGQLLSSAISFNRGMDKDCSFEDRYLYVSTVWGLCSHILPILEESYSVCLE
jgi:hypothetical protein